MAPSPDNDTTPKAPDKPRHEKCLSSKEKNKEDKTLSDLNDGELKGLLDEAINYRNPKDREGKSKLFNHLLNEAEEDERNARAARAGGSELVRYCNPAAKRNSRHRKKPSSISENMMHGGSLDNLAKDELFETSKHRTKKSVSARQREGGSLPCNVNVTTIPNHEYQFLEEARKKKEMTEKKNNDIEAQSLLEHDSLDQNYQEQSNEISHYSQYKFTTRASLQVNVSEYGNNDRNRAVEKKGLHQRVPVFQLFMSRAGPDNEVDGPIQFPHLEPMKTSTTNKPNTQIVGSEGAGALKFSNDGKTTLKNLPSLTNYDRQKVDENCNAVSQNSNKNKKKKVVTDKNVVVCSAENVKGHRSDIIHDLRELIKFIDSSEKNHSIKSKQLNRHSSDDTNKSKKRTHSSKGKDNGSTLQKSNSLGEISTTKLDDFNFSEDKVVMRNNKSDSEKPRERRSLGNMEPLQNLYTNASAENLETAELWEVKRRKKKSRTKSSSNTVDGKDCMRGPPPDRRRQSPCSVSQSEKSNDTSDVDSVDSLPIDTQGGLDLQSSRFNMQISYADMAKINEKPKEKKSISPNDKVPKEQTDSSKSVGNHNLCDNPKTNICDTGNIVKNTPPDVHNIKNFPAITKQVTAQANVLEKSKSSNKLNKTLNLHKNVKNNMNKTNCVTEHQIQSYSEETEMGYSSSLPPDIPDVQTIEKMQLLNQGHPSNCYTNNSVVHSGSDYSSVVCDIIERTSNIDERPPVVILSGCGKNDKPPGVTFGFELNEQLLSEDNNIICSDFAKNYLPPENYTSTSYNHEEVVSFIDKEWNKTLLDMSTGKVQYYSELP